LVLFGSALSPRLGVSVPGSGAARRLPPPGHVTILAAGPPPRHALRCTFAGSFHVSGSLRQSFPGGDPNH
jgi:hypothetical protein